MYLKPWRPQSCSCNLFSGYEESWMERSEASDDAVFWKETEGEKVNVCVSLRTFKDGRGLIHLGKIMPHLLVCSIIYLKSDMFRHSPTAQPTAELSQLVHPSPAHLPLCTHISLSLSLPAQWECYFPALESVVGLARLHCVKHRLPTSCMRSCCIYPLWLFDGSSAGLPLL